MQANKVIKRNRRIPNRATGHLFFTIKWPGGSHSDRIGYRTDLDAVVRLFTERLRYVPREELEFASGFIDAAVRRKKGGEKHIRLASWSAGKSLPEFFQTARTAWSQLPKEADDENRRVSVNL